MRRETSDKISNNAIHFLNIQVLSLFDFTPCYNEKKNSDKISLKCRLKKKCLRSLGPKSYLSEKFDELSSCRSGIFYSSTGADKSIHKLLNNLRKVSPYNLWKGIWFIIQIRIMPYAWFHLRVMDVYYALSQSVCQLYASYVLQNDRGDNSIWVFCIPNP